MSTDKVFETIDAALWVEGLGGARHAGVPDQRGFLGEHATNEDTRVAMVIGGKPQVRLIRPPANAVAF